MDNEIVFVPGVVETGSAAERCLFALSKRGLIKKDFLVWHLTDLGREALEASELELGHLFS